MIEALIEILEANKASQKALAEEVAHCKQDLYEAIVSYQKRERRFGKTSEQLSA
jgi:hypothetical protein